MAATLESLLHRVQRLQRRDAMLRAAAVGAASLGSAVLLAVLIDATFALPLIGLVLVNVLLIGVLVVGIALLARAWRATQYEPRRLARLLERRLNIEDSRFINAVDFDAQQTNLEGSAADVSAELRRLAVKHGESAADTVAAGTTVDATPTKRALTVLMGVMVVLLMVGVIAPRLYTMGLPRLLNPAGDHPPFTLLNFDIATSPDPLHHGYDAVIEANITGPTQPTRAAVHFLPQSKGASAERVAMLRAGDGRFTLPLEAATQSRRFYIETADGRSGVHDLHVLPTPTFKAVTVDYAYPDYTGWPAASRSLSEQGIRAVRGTEIKLTVRSNLPLDHGRWKVDDGEALKLAPDADDPTVARGSFTLSRSGSFELSLIAADGHESLQTLSGPVEAVADDEPFVQIIDPDLRLIAPPGWSVPIRALATDDVGISRMVLHQSLNRGEAQETPLAVDRRRNGQAAEGSQTISLASMEAEAGDTLRGFVTAYDAQPDRPNAADSETFTIRIVTDEEYRELARQQYRAEQIAAEIQQLRDQQEALTEQRDALVEELEQLQERLGDDGATDAEREEMAALQQQIEAYADRLDELADAMRERAEQYDLYTFEAPYREMLEQMAEQMEAEAAAAREASGSLGEGSPEAVDAAIAALRDQQEQAGQRQEQLERTERQLRQLAAAQRLQAAVQQIVAITEQQRDLSDRLSPYAETGQLEADELSRAAGLGNEQHTLREELGRVLEDLEAAAADAEPLLPTMANSGTAIADQIRELQVEQDQQAAGRFALEGAGNWASTHADAAATNLESLLSQCEAMGSGESLGEIDNPLSLSESQMAQCMSEMASANQAPGQGQSAGSGQGTAGSGGTAAGGEGQVGPGSQLDGFTAASPNPNAGASAAASPFDGEADGFGTAGQGSGRAEDRPGSAETINIADPDRRRSAPPHAAGVPLQFRDMTQQYFRRLADDSR
ncbi:MAG: hypothetical protein WD294_04425 [Phycisphaeraceae bacterium]